MQSHVRKNRIHTLLARFAGEVKNANAINWYDLNRESQNFLVPCFQILFKAPQLHNLDIDKNNSLGIDLADDSERLAFQVTSDSSGKKVKETLEKFRDHGLNEKYDKLIIYIIGDKQNKYTIDFSRYTPDNFIFDKTKDIVDQNDVIKKIESCSDLDQQTILNLLEDNFSDRAIDNRLEQKERIENHKAVFVPPAEYDDALNILRSYGLVVLSGPPHIGKTETAYALLDEVSKEKQFSNATYMKSDWDKLFSSRRKAILIDDAFGSSVFDTRTIADRFDELINLAKNNCIVVTSRQGILDEACKTSRIGQGPIANLRIDLQEGSYDYTALSLILHNHIAYAQNRTSDNQRKLSDFQAKKLLDHEFKIIEALHFPHNIERLVNFHAINSDIESDIYILIKSAKEIEFVVQQWYQNQDIHTKILVVMLTLFPDNPADFTETFYSKICFDLGIKTTDIQSLIRNACGYIQIRDSVINLAHPSYAEGIYVCLKDSDLDFAWSILRLISKHALRQDINMLIQCRSAGKKISNDWKYWYTTKTPKPYTGTVDEYFEEFIIAYNHIIKINFPNIISSFLPNWNEEACIYLEEKDEKIIFWSIGQKRKDTNFVNTLRNTSVDGNIMDNWGNYYELGVNKKNSFSDNNLYEIPQIAAFDYVIKQMMDYLGDPLKSKKKFLSESWHLQMSGLLIQLKKSELFDIDALNIDNPFNEEKFKKTILLLIDAINGHTAIPGTQIIHEITEDLSPWPTNITINHLDVRLIVQYINKLEKEGHLITGDFLVPPDRAWDEALLIYKPKVSFTDRYTDQQLIRAVNTAVSLLFEAYQKTVELSFPTIYRYLRIYNYFPIKIDVVIDRESECYFSDTSISYGIRSLQKESFLSNCEIEIYLISENINEIDRKKAKEIQAGFYERFKENNYFRSGGFENDFVMNLEKWHKEVISWINSDLNQLFNDRFF
jgi:DNA polymerase III delta prime subunit